MDMTGEKLLVRFDQLARESRALENELAAMRFAQEWNYDMAQAPRNGTLLLLLIIPDENRDHPLEDTANPSLSIGHNNFDNDGDDVWQFAGWSWEQDCYTEGRGKPGAWKIAPIAGTDNITGRHAAGPLNPLEHEQSR